MSVVRLEDEPQDVVLPTTSSESSAARAKAWARRVGRFLVDQWFPIALVACVGISYGLRDIGSKQGPLHPSETTLALIVVIFLLSGLSMDPKAMWAGLKHWRLLLVAQTISLLFAPMFVYCVTLLLRGHVNSGILDGIVLVSAVPTTISSAYVLTVEMHGNTGAALVQCTLGNFLGVFVTPGWLLLLLGSSEHAGHAENGTGSSTSEQIGKSLLTLGGTVVLPLVIGMIVRRVGGERIAAFNKRTKSITGFVNKFSLFIIVFFAFCESFASDAFAQLSGSDLAASGALCVGLHFVLLLLSSVVAMRVLKFSRPDTVAVTLCSAQKTLALAMPLLALFFAPQSAGLCAVPILMYHPMQVALGGILTVRVRKWVDAAAPPANDVPLVVVAPPVGPPPPVFGASDADDGALIRQEL